MKKFRVLAAAASVAMILGTMSGCSSKDSAYRGSKAGGGYYNSAENNYSEMNTEEYSTIKENPFLSAKTNPLSTFSADVDTASYANVRRMINQGSNVVTDAVRIEEMINYFNYDYKQPQGSDPFSVTTEIAGCPWNMDSKLLSIGIKAKDIDYAEMPKSNIVFLIDVSGSMGQSNKLPLLIQSFSMLVENMNNDDIVSIVTYAGSDTIALEGVKGSNKKEIISTLEELISGGSTNGASGINTAYELAEKYFIKGGNNRVIIATDGDLNVGVSSESGLKELIESKKKTGVFLSVLGFGMGNYKDNKMEAMADNGNGNYAYIDTLLEAKKVLVEEMGGTLFTVAKDVKFQVEFNPAIVKGYRLIGYENRLLNTEDFNNDNKDAGEIGAGHRVTVLYEVVMTDSKMNIPETQLKNQDESQTTIKSDEWLTVNIRYKEPDKSESKLLSYPVDSKSYTKTPSENILFASSVAQFGMLLRKSEYKGTSTYKSLLDTLSQLDCVKNDQYKKEFVTLVKKVNN